MRTNSNTSFCRFVFLGIPKLNDVVFLNILPRQRFLTIILTTPENIPNYRRDLSAVHRCLPTCATAKLRGKSNPRSFSGLR